MTTRKQARKHKQQTNTNISKPGQQTQHNKINKKHKTHTKDEQNTNTQNKAQSNRTQNE